MKKKLLLTCQTMKNEVIKTIEEQNSDIPVHFMPNSLHSSPKKLHEYLQNVIDSTYNVDEILILNGSCGGGGENLKATTADLILPKASDCIDVLLSGSNTPRSQKSMYFTKSWMEFVKASDLDFEKQAEKKGTEKAKSYLKMLYKNLDSLKIIDTGSYDISPVIEYLKPISEFTGLNVEIVKGEYLLIKNLISGNYENNFRIIKKIEA